MPEFIAYLAEQGEAAPGTHTLSVDRGSHETRKSICMRSSTSARARKCAAALVAT